MLEFVIVAGVNKHGIVLFIFMCLFVLHCIDIPITFIKKNLFTNIQLHTLYLYCDLATFIFIY